MNKLFYYLIISVLLVFMNPVFAGHQQREFQTFSDFAKVLKVVPVYGKRVIEHDDRECRKKHMYRDQKRQQNRSDSHASRNTYFITRNAADCRQKVKRNSKHRSHIIAYKVKYKYRGNTYRTRMKNHPGKRLRVKVNIVPDE